MIKVEAQSDYYRHYIVHVSTEISWIFSEWNKNFPFVSTLHFYLYFQRLSIYLNFQDFSSLHSDPTWSKEQLWQVPGVHVVIPNYFTEKSNIFSQNHGPWRKFFVDNIYPSALTLKVDPLFWHDYNLDITELNKFTRSQLKSLAFLNALHSLNRYGDVLLAISKTISR